VSSRIVRLEAKVAQLEQILSQHVPVLFNNQRELVNKSLQHSAAVLALSDILMSSTRISKETFERLCQDKIKEIIDRAKVEQEQLKAEMKQRQAQQEALRQQAEAARDQILKAREGAPAPAPTPDETTETVEVGAEILNRVIAPDGVGALD
jgi:outer membrane murein-binding lipoprotein Lpp